jgi:DNA-directed RNA polymerase specialized sigma24 family protein
MRDTKLAVVRAFAQLNSSDRLLLRLRFAESLSFVEVARLLGLKGSPR